MEGGSFVKSRSGFMNTPWNKQIAKRFYLYSAFIGGKLIKNDRNLGRCGKKQFQRVCALALAVRGRAPWGLALAVCQSRQGLAAVAIGIDSRPMAD